MVTKQTFSSVLDTPSSQIDRTVKQLPPGTYTAMVVGQPRIDKSTKKGTEFSEYTMRIMEAHDDVDEDALEEYLTRSDGTKKLLQDCTIRNTYYHTEAAIGRLLTFFDHLDGLKPNDAKEVDDSPKQRMNEVAGKQCLIHIRHEPLLSGEGVIARIGSTSLIED